MRLNIFVEKIKNQPARLEFEDVMALIDAHYTYTETAFSNGVEGDRLENGAGENAGSCRIFAFAQLLGLNEQETLACFGRYYRDDVLAHPEGSDHGNIRTFMRHGWQGICFEKSALEAK